MEKAKKIIAPSFLAILLLAIIAPLTAIPVSANENTESSVPVTLPNWHNDKNWAYVQNDLITIMFPSDGKKPMFLWWYTNDPNNINVVKFKGLMEYTTYNTPYFLWRNQANASEIAKHMREQYFEPKQNTMGEMKRMQLEHELEGMMAENADETFRLHAPYLPFSGSKWELSQPVLNVTRGDVKYLSFNFTLVDVLGRRPNFQFAENNIIIRCRFYYTPATENVYDKYTYSVDAGEFKIDLVIKHWEWNIDKIAERLRALGLTISEEKAGLALWVNLASINMTKLPIVENDAKNLEDTDLTEQQSTAHSMYIEGDKVSVIQNDTERMMDEIPLQNSLRERFKIRFETGNATTFAGFFKFVPQAIITNGTSHDVVDVTASYISAGAHVRLFISYPYFGDATLEHDPSIGVESVAPWLPINLLMILIGATIAIAIAVAAIKLRKKTVNIVTVQ